MGLPDIHFNRSNGNLGRTQSTPDNVFAFLVSGTAVAGKIALGQPKLLTGTDSLTDLGITLANNPLAYKTITKFYGIVGEGLECYLMLYSNATLLADVCDPVTGVVLDLINEGDGNIRYLFIDKLLPDTYVLNLVDGLDADVWNAAANLQTLSENFSDDNDPIGAVLPGFGFAKANIAALRDLNTMDKNRVSITLAAYDVDGSPAIPQIAGWAAKFPLHQNIARVLNGSVLETAFFMDGTPANDKSIKNSLGLIHDRRYIIFRKIKRKSGFYFNDDPCACSKADDYSSISWNRVMNKAHITAYNTLIDHLNDDVEPDPQTGGISLVLAKDWESQVERDLTNELIKPGHATAVKCFIDPAQVNLQTDEIEAELSVVRKGQAKGFKVTLKYTTTV